MPPSLRKSLCASTLISAVHGLFSKIPDPRDFNGNNSIRLSDHLMSGLAIFGLKFPSLLQYDRRRKDSATEKNLKNLYYVNTPPSDTYMRERLDEIHPDYLRSTFKKLFAKLQRGKVLEEFQYLNGHYLLSLDGTGQFSSGNVCCKHCCRKEHKNGKVTFYHQMLGGCIVHPNKSKVIPLCPELIQNLDGHNKNDCERNASKRFIENFRREHPHLKVIVVEDGLASNAPHIRHLEDNNMRYILGAKPGDHAFLFKQIEENKGVQYYEFKDEKGYLHQFRYVNKVSLNRSHPDLKVNFLEYRQTNLNGKETNFSWVTNIAINENNIVQIMKGGRARWKIENETYNTLKNLGYNFEHSYGHGKQYLSTVFCLLMMISFLIDQIQEISCQAFQLIRKVAGTYQLLWNSMKFLFEYVEIQSWELFYDLIGKKRRLNSS